MYSTVPCLSVRYFWENSRILERWVFSSRVKMESKCCACDTQVGSFARAASGEFGEGGSPARNRAASSAVAVSELLARTAPNTTVKAIRIVAIILVALTDTFLLSERLSTPMADKGSSTAELWRHMFPGSLCILLYSNPNAREREALEAANPSARSHKSRESC